MTAAAPSIQLFVPHIRKDEVINELAQCFDIGWTGMGFKTAELEEAWSAYTGLAHSHFLNSATAALHIAVEILKQTNGWVDGDEIITPSLTFVSTNHAVMYSGLKPVFADVDEFLCLDPNSIAERIGPRTRAVIYVGLGGNSGKLQEVSDLCRERGLKLILDAAHMGGTRYKGRDAGHWADVACYSFQAVKNMPTADSGMVCFADAGLDAAARRFSWLGISKDTYARSNKGNYSWRYDVDEVGYKYNGNAVMAAIGLVSLKYLDSDNARRRAISDIYAQAFEGRNAIELVPVAPDCESSRHLFQILVDDRDELLQSLNERSIFPGVHYLENTQFKPYRYGQGTCPRAERASSRLLSLPLHMRLTDADVGRVCDAVIELTGG